MAVVSKQYFDAVAKDAPCYMVIHPHIKSCLERAPSIYIAFLIGSAKFFSVIYVAQLLMQGRNILNKKRWMTIAKNYARSTITGMLVSVTGFQLICLMRRLLGYFPYNFFLAAPFALSGIFLAIETHSRRTLITTVYFNLMIEYCLRCLERAGYISITKTKQVFLFMIGSSLLLYLMRLEKERGKTTPVLWLINPEKVKTNSDEHLNPCPHKEQCKEYILKHVSTYFRIGLLVSLIKLVPLLRTPIKAISSIQAKHFKLALFLSSYVGIYKAIICYYRRSSGYDSSSHALPAGFAAGLSLIFNPNLMLSIAPFTAAIKLYSRTLYEKNILPSSFPLSIILFCICQGTLSNARLLDPEICPRYVLYLSNTVTNGISQTLCDNLARL